MSHRAVVCFFKIGAIDKFKIKKNAQEDFKILFRLSRIQFKLKDLFTEESDFDNPGWARFSQRYVTAAACISSVAAKGFGLFRLSLFFLACDRRDRKDEQKQASQSVK